MSASFPFKQQLSTKERQKMCDARSKLGERLSQLLSNSENSSKIVQPKQFPQAVQTFIDPRLLDGCVTDELTTFRALANSQPRLRSTHVPRRCCVLCALCADRTRPARARTRTWAASGLQPSSTEFHLVRAVHNRARSPSLCGAHNEMNI